MQLGYIIISIKLLLGIVHLLWHKTPLKQHINTVTQIQKLQKKKFQAYPLNQYTI